MKNILAYSMLGCLIILEVLSLISNIPHMIVEPEQFAENLKWADPQWLGPVLLIALAIMRKKYPEYLYGWFDRIFVIATCLGVLAYGSQVIHLGVVEWLSGQNFETQGIGKLIMPIAYRASVIVALLIVYLIIQSKFGMLLTQPKDQIEFGASKNKGRFKETKFKKEFDIDHIPKKNPGDILVCWDRQTGKGVIIPEKDRSLHLFCAGPTGSGKSSTLVLPMIYQDLKVPNSGVGLIEPKGDIAADAYKMAIMLGRKDAILFDPTNKDTTIYFNPLDPMNGSDYDVINLMTTVYDGMAGGPNTDPFFHKNSMMVLRKSLDLLLRLKRLEGSVLTLRELGTFLTGKTTMINYCKKLASYRRPEDEALLEWFYSELLADTKNAQNNQGYYVGLRQEIELLGELDWLNGDPKTGRSQLNFDELLANGGAFFASTGFGALGTMGNYLGQFLIMAFQNAVFRRPGNENTRKPFYMYVDEFSLYANDNFEKWLALARSYRCPAHLFTQGTAQLDKVSEEFKRSAINNCRHKIIFAPEEESEAKYWSEYFGETYREKISRNTNKGVSKRWNLFNIMDTPDNISDSEGENVSEELVKNFTPTDIMNMPFKHVIYKTVKDGTNQVARYGVTDWIPKKVNDVIKQMDLRDYKPNTQFHAGTSKQAQLSEEEDMEFA